MSVFWLIISGFINCRNRKLLVSHFRKLKRSAAMIRLVNSKNFGAVENSSNDVAVSLAYKSRQNCLDKVKALLLIYF